MPSAHTIVYGWVITSYTKKLAQKLEKVSSSVNFNEICYLFFPVLWFNLQTFFAVFDEVNANFFGGFLH